MLSDVRTPKQGDEVQFADGSTGLIKQFVRSRILDGHPAYVVEMAKPCRYEYVTLVAFLTSGFWQAVTTLAAGPAEEQVMARVYDDVAVKGYDVAAPARMPLRTLVPVGMFFLGCVVGWLIALLPQWLK